MAERTPRTDPVVVTLHVEGFNQVARVQDEIPRDEWEAMTPAERVEALDDMADVNASNFIGYGWQIEDPDDSAATQ